MSYVACGDCHGEGCNNSEEVVLDSEKRVVVLMQEAFLIVCQLTIS